MSTPIDGISETRSKQQATPADTAHATGKAPAHEGSQPGHSSPPSDGLQLSGEFDEDLGEGTKNLLAGLTGKADASSSQAQEGHAGSGSAQTGHGASASAQGGHGASPSAQGGHGASASAQGVTGSAKAGGEQVCKAEPPQHASHGGGGGILGSILGGASSVVGTIAQGGEDVANTVAQGGKDFAGAVSSGASTVANGAKSLANDAYNAGKSAVDSVVGARIDIPSPTLPPFPKLNPSDKAAAEKRGAGQTISVPSQHDPNGGTHEPVSIIVDGSLKNLTSDLQKEGWHDPNFTPISPMTLNGKPSVAAYAKNENPLSRDHLRIFSMGTSSKNGEQQWGITSTRDTQPFVQLPGDGHSFSVGHIIDTNIDGERDMVANDLINASPQAKSSFTIVNGDRPGGAKDIKTDGQVYLFNVGQ